MRSRRLLWLAAALLAAVLYLFENNGGTLALLVCLLLLAPAGALTLAGKVPGAELILPPSGEKGGQAEGTLRLKNPTILPRGRVALILVSRNLRTGEETRCPVETGLGPRETLELPFTLDCAYCGRVEVSVKELCVMDPLGLFARPVPAEVRGAMTVAPTLFDCAVSLAAGSAGAERETETPVRPGSDPGLWLDLREYVLGDPIRRIHWKLSEKTDTLLVRQFGEPGSPDTALVLDRRPWASPREADGATEIFASLSAGLLRAGIVHKVLWPTEAPQAPAEYEITGEEVLARMLGDLMELPPLELPDLGLCLPGNYAHVILVGSGPEAPAAEPGVLTGLRRILPGRVGLAEGLQPDGSIVLTFDEDRYAAELGRIEV